MAADLAEFEEGVEDDDLAAFEALFCDGGLDLFIDGGADGFVEVGLGFIEVDVVGEFGFRWEVFGDGVFGAAEEEGFEAGAEAGLCVGVVFFLDGVTEEGAEGILFAEVAGHEEVEEGPEFAEVVFHGGAGEAEAVVGVE